MALIKNLTKKEQTARLGVTLPESVLRKLDAYRMYLETETGYLPERGETVEKFLLYVFGEDKGFVKWYKPEDKAQAAALDALQKKDAAAPAPTAKSAATQDLSDLSTLDH